MDIYSLRTDELVYCTINNLVYTNLVAFSLFNNVLYQELAQKIERIKNELWIRKRNE
jgi:hypothetical protein